MKTSNEQMVKIESRKITVLTMMLLTLIILILYFFYTSNNNLLADKIREVLMKINNSRRSWAYVIDGVIGLGVLARTKNPFVFFSVLTVVFGITIINQMIGV